MYLGFRLLRISLACTNVKQKIRWKSPKRLLISMVKNFSIEFDLKKSCFSFLDTILINQTTTSTETATLLAKYRRISSPSYGRFHYIWQMERRLALWDSRMNRTDEWMSASTKSVYLLRAASLQVVVVQAYTINLISEWTWRV